MDTSNSCSRCFIFATILVTLHRRKVAQGHIFHIVRTGVSHVFCVSFSINPFQHCLGLGVLLVLSYPLKRPSSESLLGATGSCQAMAGWLGMTLSLPPRTPVGHILGMAWAGDSPQGLKCLSEALSLFGRDQFWGRDAYSFKCLELSFHVSTHKERRVAPL